LMKFSTMTN